MLFLLLYTDEETEAQRSPRVTQPVKGKDGIPPNTVLLRMTHSHSTPATSPRGRYDLLTLHIRKQVLRAPRQSPHLPPYSRLTILAFHKKNRQMGGREGGWGEKAPQRKNINKYKRMGESKLCRFLGENSLRQS